MNNKNIYQLTFIIRASGEATVDNLKSQLSKQISKSDKLIILGDEVSFEKKLKQGYELAIKEANPITVFIDGDILLRSNAVKRIRKISKELPESDFGFGLKLWDRFYDRPKFRGLHVYNTGKIQEALKHIPQNGNQLRPESFVKKKMEEAGSPWRNNITLHVAGIHDFYQRPQDIYYKFLIRSKRSKHDVKELKSIFQSDPSNLDYKYALKGLDDGSQLDEVLNDKYQYFSNEFKQDQPTPCNSRTGLFIDLFVIKKLIKYYKFKSIFWKSI